MSDDDRGVTLDDLTPREIAALKRLAQEYADGGIGRRDVVKAGGLLGLGALGAIGAGGMKDEARQSPAGPKETDIGQISEQSLDTIDGVHYAAPKDDLQAKLNDLGIRDELLILGDHTTSGGLNPPDNCTITVRGTITLEDHSNNNMFVRTDGPKNITIRGPGVLDGNKTSQIYEKGTRVERELVRLQGAGAENITVCGIEVRNAIAGAGLKFAGPVTNLRVSQNYIHHNGTDTAPADGIFHHANNAVIDRNHIVNITDTHIAGDNCVDTSVIGNYTVNESSYVPPAQAITMYARDIEWHGRVVGNYVEVPGADTAITTFGETAHAVHTEVTGNVVMTAGTGDVIHLQNNAVAPVVTSNRILECSPNKSAISILCDDALVFGNYAAMGGYGIYAENSNRSVVGFNNLNTNIGIQQGGTDCVYIGNILIGATTAFGGTTETSIQKVGNIS